MTCIDAGKIEVAVYWFDLCIGEIVPCRIVRNTGIIRLVSFPVQIDSPIYWFLLKLIAAGKMQQKQKQKNLM